MIHKRYAYKIKILPNWERVGVNKKLEKFLKKIMIWKILHVKDTDGSNRVDSEIDCGVKIFDIFDHSRPFSSISTG